MCGAFSGMCRTNDVHACQVASHVRWLVVACFCRLSYQISTSAEESASASSSKTSMPSPATLPLCTVTTVIPIPRSQCWSPPVWIASTLIFRCLIPRPAPLPLCPSHHPAHSSGLPSAASLPPALPRLPFATLLSLLRGSAVRPVCGACLHYAGKREG